MKTQCPHCKVGFNTKDANVGKQAKCPKCAKPFTIEPFIETPVVAEPAAKSPEPPETPKKIAEPAPPPVKSPELAAPPAETMQPAESAAPPAPPEKIAKPVKQEKPEQKKSSKIVLSKTVYVYCWLIVRIIVGILGGLGLMLAIRKGAHSTSIATVAAADVFLVCSVLIELSLFYKMWAAIQDGRASISGAKAVALLFIPVFNLYWALCMVIGFAEDYNAFIKRCPVKTRELPLMLYLVYAFMFMLSVILVTTPMICVLAFPSLISRVLAAFPVVFRAFFFFALGVGVGHFITYILFAARTCNAINALPGREK